jgi:DNA-binding CsgD family transcriptional regulator
VFINFNEGGESSMPKEILGQIIHQRLFLPLAIILLVYYINWFFLHSLSFQILGVKVGVKRIILWAAPEVLYCLVGKQFISNKLIFGIIIILLFTLITKIIVGNVSSLKSFLSVIITQFISGLGVIILFSPLYTLNESIFKLMFETPWGVAIGTLFEIIFPLIAFFCFRYYHISPLSNVGNKATKLAIVGAISFGLLFFLIYNSVLLIFVYYKTMDKRTLLMNMFCQWIAELGMGLSFYAFNSLDRKERETDYLKHEAEHKTLESKNDQLVQKVDILETEKGEVVQEREVLKTERDELVDKVNKLMEQNKQLIEKSPSPEEVDFILKNTISDMQGMRKSISDQKKYDIVLSKTSKTKVKLSSTEMGILELVIQGKNNKEIAKELHFSEGHVRNVISGLKEELELKSQRQLILFVIKNKLVDDDDE